MEKGDNHVPSDSSSEDEDLEYSQDATRDRSDFEQERSPTQFPFSRREFPNYTYI
jgi:hypothetical protein